MKLMFASDLHGSLSATEKILALFEQSHADWLILLGDLLNHGPRNALPERYQPIQVAEQLNHYRDKIIAVRGNCDSEVDQMLLTFPIMSPFQQVLLPKRRLFLTHGHLYHPDTLPPLSHGDVLIYGHTHLPHAEWQEGICCFNPGSVSIPKEGFPASYGMLENDMLSVVGLHNGKAIAEVALTH
ncbi:phosphodiesterase [Chania multitudinisentens RB-25]|uniref:Phosphoesterase n=1 Tax=Chania multitudinisentens RB-25 TaxID=1441930 RepID=W0L910_9GAMM|nr:phosphodiesterase [Chania multitudinisentens]AHG18762.1 phosphodiesterase [Chania multitudinisentens RB-25]